MKYAEATRGTRLKALIVSFQMGTRIDTVLEKWNNQADSFWDEQAKELQRLVVESVHAKWPNNGFSGGSS